VVNYPRRSSGTGLSSGGRPWARPWPPVLHSALHSAPPRWPGNSPRAEL